MNTDLKNGNPFIPPLRQTQLDITALQDAFLFHDGSWWKVRDVGDTLLLQGATNLEAVDILQHPGTRCLLKQQPCITLTVQLKIETDTSIPVMSIEEAAGIINVHFPHEQSHIAYDPLVNQIYLKLNQDRLTYAQIDWLELSTFASAYIEGYNASGYPTSTHW